MASKPPPDEITTSSDGTLKQKLMIKNKLGLHARPAALFVQAANRFKSEISVQKGRERVNGKSIMGIMMLAAGPGSSILVEAKGDDAKQALAALAALVATNFGEE